MTVAPSAATKRKAPEPAGDPLRYVERLFQVDVIFYCLLASWIVAVPFVLVAPVLGWVWVPVFMLALAASLSDAWANDGS